MKNILILEDDMERMKHFNENLKGHQIMHVDTASEATVLLENYDFDYVFLDHDLGGEIMVDSFATNNTGYTVAVWMEGNPEHKPDKIVIHSFNPVGAENMQRALPEAAQIPAAWNYDLETIDRHFAGVAA